jgi:hypothetical protein
LHGYVINVDAVVGENRKLVKQELRLKITYLAMMTMAGG